MNATTTTTTFGQKFIEDWKRDERDEIGLDETIITGIGGKLKVGNVQGASDWLDGFLVALAFYGIPQSGQRITARTINRIHDLASKLQGTK